MLVPARRLLPIFLPTAHVATTAPRILHRCASTTTEREPPRRAPGMSPDVESLSAVECLLADPVLLPKHVRLFLARAGDWQDTQTAHDKRLLNMLSLSPSVNSRWDDAARILDRHPDEAFRIALQPSHAEAVELFVQTTPKMNEDLREKAFRRILNTRYADAPFIALEHVLRIAETVPESDVIGSWLLRLPRHLARVSTNWERPLFDLDATRREVVRQLHALEHQSPALVANSTVQPPLLHAYAAARIAPDDAARIWSAILARCELVSLRTAERALAATRDLDTLKHVFMQIQQVLARDPKTHRAMPIIEVFYAQHLTRLGARETALEAARRYPFVHPHLQWLLEEDGPGAGVRPDIGQTPDRSVVTSVYRAIARQLERNGLDLEDILFIMSVNTHLKMSIQTVIDNTLRRAGWTIPQKEGCATS